MVRIKVDIIDQLERIAPILLRHVEQTYPEKSVAMVGQCFGGMLAQYAALRYGLRAVCFNSFPMGAGLQWYIGTERLREANRLITHIGAETDFVSDPIHTPGKEKVFSFLAHIIDVIGINTPANFGRKYALPSAFEEKGDTHALILGSIIAQITGNRGDTPADLLEKMEGDMGIISETKVETLIEETIPQDAPNEAAPNGELAE